MRRFELTPLLAAACAGFAAWVSIGSLAVATTDTTSRFGFLPPLWLAPVLIAVFIFAAWFARVSRDEAVPLFFSLVLLLPWIPGRVPAAFLLWTGPVAAAVWAVVAIGMFVVRVEKRTRAPFSTTSFAPAALAFVAYLAGGWWLSGMLPGGDEPHYLMITQSVLHDGDLRIENNHAQGQYREFVGRELRPHFLKRGVNGEIYSVHAPGLPILIAPAFAAFGYPGVVVFLALVAAAGSSLVWRAAHLLTGDPAAAWFAWAAGALSAPFYFEAFTVFPDGVGATLVLLGVLPLLEGPLSSRRWFGIGTALAFLPWLHTRFAIIAAALGLVLLLRLIGSAEGRARIVPFLAAPLASAVSWFAFFRIVYGVFDPSAPYGGNTQTRAANILNGFPALMFDQQFGVLPNAPIYAFCFAGLVALGRRRPRLAIEMSVIALAYVPAVSAFHMWWGGASAPARFLAPVLPMLAIPASWLWHATPHRATRAVGLAGLVASMLMTVMLAVPEGGALAYNVRDGYARVADWINPVVDVSLGLPSFFRHAREGLLLRAAVWTGFAGAAVIGLHMMGARAGTRAALALATPALLAVASMGAFTAVWALEDVPAPDPQKSQLQLLGSYEGRFRNVGLKMSPFRLDAASTTLNRIVLSTPSRRGAPGPGTLLLVPGIVRAGVYELHRDRAASAAGPARLVIGRLARASKVWDLTSDFRNGAPTLELPVHVGSLIIAGDPGSEPGLTLRPIEIFEGQSSVTRDIARRVERLGSALVFFFDMDTFPEEAAFWVRGGREAQIAVARPETGALQMFLRNAAADNEVTINIDGVEQSWSLKPREERTLPVPFDGRRHAALIRIDSVSGFRPSEVEPGSTDTRFLGVWIEFR